MNNSFLDSDDFGNIFKEFIETKKLDSAALTKKFEDFIKETENDIKENNNE